MRSYRRSVAMFSGAVLAASALTLPAQGMAEPTTLAIEGTLEVVVIDHAGPGDHPEQLHTVVTDDGAEIPVELGEQAPANGRFRGEVVIAGGVASSLRAEGLLPRAGGTIDDDSRAGRVAVAAADDLAVPLAVASSAIAPVTAAAVTTRAPHRAYVAVVDDRGTFEESNDDIVARVNEIAAYWTEESGGVISSFTIAAPVTRYHSADAGQPDASCGMGAPDAVWDEARAKFPTVSFAADSRNHLIVALADECGAPTPGGSSIVGVAEVGTDFSSGGQMSFSLGDIATQVGVHEIGHTFGLGHANLQRCSGCAIEEYDHLYSPMGAAVHGGYKPTALDSAFRDRLGIADPAEVPLVTAANGPVSRNVRLAPRGAATGPRGIEIVDPISGSHYFVEHRPGTDRDSEGFYQASGHGSVGTGIVYRPGVAITTYGGNGSITLLPSTPSVAAHGPGQIFTSPTGGTRIAINDVADINVTFNLPLKRLTTKKPKIIGTARVRRTLKTKVGSWSPRPAYRYQWYANGKKITKKGTKSSFKLTSRQKGKRITVRVTGSKSGYVTVVKASKSTKKVAKRR